MARITKDTRIEDLMESYPQAVQILIRLDLPCLVCGEPFWGTIEELAQTHNADLHRILQCLNEDLEGLRA